MLGYFAIWLGLIALAMPVAFSLAFMGIAWLFIEGQSITQAAQRLIGGIDSFRCWPSPASCWPASP